jgi:hypothetical protein
MLSQAGEILINRKSIGSAGVAGSSDLPRRFDPAD